MLRQFLMKDDSTRRIYRLYDFIKSLITTPGQYYCCVSGKVNSAEKLYLVIESVRYTRRSGDRRKEIRAPNSIRPGGPDHLTGLRNVNGLGMF